MMDFRVQTRQVSPGLWEWRVVDPSGGVAKSSSELYKSESEARTDAERSMSKLSHDSGWSH